MTVSNLNPKALNITNSPVPASDNKEQNKACFSTQDVAAPAKTEPAVSDETLAAIAQHPLADLFGKYSGEVWEEIFAELEQDRLDRQNGQNAPEENTAASQE